MQNSVATKQYEKPSAYFSNKVTIVSFIMAIFVISIHANNLKYYGLEGTTSALAFQEVKIIADIIGGIAVPFFFMLSGYWFFRMDISTSSVWDKVKMKNKKKIRTLIVPYLLWNAFGTVFYMAITRIPSFAAQMNNGEAIPITLKTIGGGVLLHDYYFPFWYLQDLIIISFVLAPIMVLVLRNKMATGMCLIGLTVLSCMNISFSWPRTSSILVFFIGGTLAVFGDRFFEEKQNNKTAITCGLLLFVCCIIRYFGLPIVSSLFLYISPFLMWKTFDLVDFHKAKWFEHQSFFVYAAHVIPATVLSHLLTKVSTSSLWAAGAYLIAIGITLGLIYVIGKILDKILPKFYKVICGGR